MFHLACANNVVVPKHERWQTLAVSFEGSGHALTTGQALEQTWKCLEVYSAESSSNLIMESSEEQAMSLENGVRAFALYQLRGLSRGT